MKTRFAPSPTGYLHIGNMRTALLCYLYAQKACGTFMLRIDDTDAERSKEEYVDRLKEDLTWLGISWDEEARQSDRLDAYQAAITQLKESGRLYACYESKEELDVKRKMQLSRGLPPIYDRAGLKLTDAEIATFEAEGRTPHYRFKLHDSDLAWEDEIRGSVCFSAAHTSDPILVRENGAFTYMLPSTVDDIAFEITHVLRGEDHVNNTAIQLQLFEALGGKIPTFAHNALIKSKEGKISKRAGGFSVRDLRDEGVRPMAIASFLAKIGTSDNVELRDNLQALAEEFDISRFSKSSTSYDPDDIYRLNTQILHHANWDEVKAEIAALGVDGADEAFWHAVRANISSIAEVQEWWQICRKPLQGTQDSEEDAQFVRDAADLLPDGEFHAETWSQWIASVKEASGRKGKGLFMPIRRALSAQDHGPELAVLLPLIGRDRAIKRLQGDLA